MKKILTFFACMLSVCAINSAVFAMAGSIPIKSIEVTDLDEPYYSSSKLDTSVKISNESHSNFVSIYWTTMPNGEYKATITTTPSYYTYYYAEDIKVTINGEEAEIEEFNLERKNKISFSYTFPAMSENNSTNSSSLMHIVSVLYMKNGKISPNPIRVAHKRSVTVQIIPDEGYEVKDVEVDGESVGAVTEYTFRKVEENHKIKAYFKPIEGYVPSENKENNENNNQEINKEDDMNNNIDENKVYEFDDVRKEDWFYEYVQYVCSNGIFEGMNDKFFAPEGATKREQLVTVLYRYAKNNNKDITVSRRDYISAFSDADQISDYAMDAIIWAYEKGIMKGKSDTILDPQGFVTREEAVAILYRFAQFAGADLKTNKSINVFAYEDSSEISEYAIEPFNWACSQGIINGITKTTIAPKGNVTRAEFAAMIQRFGLGDVH